MANQLIAPLQILNKNDGAIITAGDLKNLVVCLRDLITQVNALDPVAGALLADTITEATAGLGTTFTTKVIVSSTLSASGNLAINTNKFTVTAASGNTAVAGTLTTALGVTLTPVAAASVGNNTVFVDSGNTNKLSFKDNAGTVSTINITAP